MLANCHRWGGISSHHPPVVIIVSKYTVCGCILYAVASSSSNVQRPVINQQALVAQAPVADQRPMVDMGQENDASHSVTASDVLDQVEVIVCQCLMA